MGELRSEREGRRGRGRRTRCVCSTSRRALCRSAVSSMWRSVMRCSFAWFLASCRFRPSMSVSVQHPARGRDTGKTHLVERHDRDEDRSVQLAELVRLVVGPRGRRLGEVEVALRVGDLLCEGCRERYRVSEAEWVRLQDRATATARYAPDWSPSLPSVVRAVSSASRAIRRAFLWMCGEEGERGRGGARCKGQRSCIVTERVGREQGCGNDNDGFVRGSSVVPVVHPLLTQALASSFPSSHREEEEAKAVFARTLPKTHLELPSVSCLTPLMSLLIISTSSSSSSCV